MGTYHISSHLQVEQANMQMRAQETTHSQHEAGAWTACVFSRATARHPLVSQFDSDLEVKTDLPVHGVIVLPHTLPIQIKAQIVNMVPELPSLLSLFHA